MDVIDEEGRLFGLVNVIDALVVLLVLAVVVAGFALIDPFESGSEETRYATIDLAGQPNYVAEQISTGDVLRPEGAAGNVTITDVYVGPRSGENVSVTVRAQINGTLEESGASGSVFTYAGDALSPGSDLALESNEYTAEGTITRLARTGQTLQTRTMQVAVETRASTSVVQELADGDSYNVTGNAVATIRSFDVYPTGDDTTRRVLLGMDVRTLQRESGPHFGANRVTLGGTLPFETDSYGLSGTIIGQGSYTPAGETETRTISVKVTNVSSEFADSISEGMTEQSVEETTARIVEKRVEPASVILTSVDGEIFERMHPRHKDVYLTVEVQVRDTADGYQFHARSLKQGNTITLDFRTITVSGTVTDIQMDG